MQKGDNIELSRHVWDKLNDPTSKKLWITRERLDAVLRQPECIDTSDFPVLMAVGELSKTLSLCVVYKLVEEHVRVITFFPAERGRYERKILPGR